MSSEYEKSKVIAYSDLQPDVKAAVDRVYELRKKRYRVAKTAGIIAFFVAGGALLLKDRLGKSPVKIPKKLLSPLVWEVVQAGSMSAVGAAVGKVAYDGKVHDATLDVGRAAVRRGTFDSAGREETLKWLRTHAAVVEDNKGIRFVPLNKLERLIASAQEMPFRSLVPASQRITREHL